jgi:hypothetical protein
MTDPLYQLQMIDEINDTFDGMIIGRGKPNDLDKSCPTAYFHLKSHMN